jgi:Ca2+-binding EF-hand superfamily protein
LYVAGAFRLYDVDNDGFITRDEMYNIVDAIYQMVVSSSAVASGKGAVQERNLPGRSRITSMLKECA